MREILTNIFTWPWFSQPHGYDFNGHFIRHADGNLCIDPVEPSDEDLQQLASDGVARILITNRNHSRAANKVRARTGSRTAIHAADALHARNEGVPGKSPGEVAFHWPERKILLVGDALVGDPPGRCKLLPEKVLDDLPRLRESVRALLALDFDILLVGDGVPITQFARERLRELVDTFPR